MLYPSIDSLISKIDSKYSLVSVAAKRARALDADKNQNPLLVRYASTKNIGKALEEIDSEFLGYTKYDSDK